jgi:hypothetical protein
MRDADAEFREFSAAFAEPLTRLCYLLVATGDTRPDDDVELARRRTVRALARVRRRWRDATSGGSPEAVAVEAMLSRLPRASAVPKSQMPGVNERLDERDNERDNDEDADDAPLDAAWRAWTTLPPRERVPLLFADLGVASRHLQSVPLPDSYASERTLWRVEQAAWSKLADVEAFLGRALARAASSVPVSVDPGAQAVALAGRDRRRRGALVATAGVVAIAITAVSVSTSRHPPKAAAAGATVTPSSATVSAPPSAFVANSDEQVVDWPTRGDLKSDTALLSSLRSTFVADHPDAIGDVQILLAADTSSFRLAYVAAHSRQGLIGAWYFGPVGASKLTQGYFSYSGNLQFGSVIAAALSDPAGHSVLVVIGPPDTTSVLLSDVSAANFLDASFSPIGQREGIVVQDVSKQYLPSLFVKLFEGPQLGWNRPVPVVQLGQRVPDLPPVTVERGNPDPAVLARALQTEADWARTGELSAGGQAVVLWGGADSAGEQLVVMRVKTLHLADLLIVAWSDGDGEYLLPPDLPDYPIGFAYPTKTGARVGVLTAPGVAKAELVEDGVVTGSQPVDATGFASLPVNRPYPALAQRSFVVRLYDAAGRQVSTLPVPPQV